mmetsp:Transcript_8422/g.9125  ORF Transcript_8422/g.9125 Transcript_8422/m.9125 type:complete len:210 (-) Transcript_8422:122-751(-)|eukprot:CAMPEP_0114988322 /NCGR_PEP_ID=MMETSP0216-20121206/9531_1 /TAXON_ID=223996 /ORGANISM="Protocruzia adherens, Strain Boccale" /LENGTH=209 /DNA_ID=CAMNT_0002351083 /DNA_START=31 /DNA_END=660 /DNA_ORIENTATION=-
MARSIALVALILLVSSSNGLYFYLTEGSTKCLFEDIPKGTHMVGSYNLLERVPGGDDDGVVVTVTDPTGNEAFKTTAKGGEGKFALTTQASGSFKVCMVTTTSHWIKANKKVKMSLKLDIGESVNTEELVKGSDMSSLGLAILKINNSTKDLIKNQEFNRDKEADFREESESLNSRIVWCTLLQTAVVLLSGIWQIMSLKSFFAKRSGY